MDEERMENFDAAREAAQQALLEQEARAAQEEAAAQQAAQQQAAAQQAAAEGEGAASGANGNAQRPASEPPAQAPQDASANANVAAVAQLSAQNQQMAMQMQQLAMQNQQLQQIVQEMNNKNKEQALAEADAPPVLNMSGMWSEDENVVAQRQQEYAQQMADYMERKMTAKLAPLLETAQAGLAEREQRAALDDLSHVPELDGIMGMTPTLERIISKNPALSGSDASIEDKLITAYAIAKGAEAIRKRKEPPHVPGVDDFMQMYAQNPELQKRVELARAQKAAENRTELPPMSASGGAAGAALIPPEKPKTLDEVKELAIAKILGR